MQLISPEYKRLVTLKHETSERFGNYGHAVAQQVRDIAREIGATSILDYGCGKRGLERALGYSIRNYDPGIPGLDAAPEPADLVVCTDVLEHIEPEFLEAVLDDLKRVTLNSIILAIDTAPAKKTLADGRNAHLIIEKSGWWIPKLIERFEMWNFIQGRDSIFGVVMRRLNRGQ